MTAQMLDIPVTEKTHRFCSCGLKHRIKGGPCEGCRRVRCRKCGWLNPISSRIIICRNAYCRTRRELTDKELADNTHPKDMANCPVCGKKLRMPGARDERRQNHLKDRPPTRRLT